MSEFRNQLQAAKHEYSSAAYPGDLAADLAAATTPAPFSRVRIIVSASAVAAMLLMSIVLYRVYVGSSGSESNPPEAFAQVDAADLTLPALPELPHLPEGVSMIPELDSALTLPAMPSFPSLDDAAEQDDSSNPSQEAI